jgi:hypothetical protein
MKTDQSNIIRRLADEFCAQLLADMGRANLNKAVRLNRAEKDPRICHSHDFCDANEAMIAAFRAVVGHEPDCGNDADNALFDAAWERAKAYDFTPLRH